MSVVEIIIKTIDQSGGDINKLTSSLGDLAAKYLSIAAVAGTAYKVAGDSIKEFTESAMAAKQLSRVSGESIENASRFIEVLDDFNISQQDALVATRALTKQGLAPNIETLAKLSDQYRAIRDPQEKNEFIIKNLGKAGLQWTQVLEQGSAALREHAAAISKNLIITEDMWERAEKLRIAQDDLNDSWRAAKIRIGEELVPALSGLLKFTNDYNAAQENQVKGWERVLPPIAMTHGAIIAITEAFKGNKTATDDVTGSQADLADTTQKTKEQLQAEEDAVKMLTKQNENYLSQIGNLTDSLKDYDQKHKEIQDDLDAGNITLGEAQKKWKELADEQEKASRRMILNMLQQQLSVDGLSSAETSYLLDLGLKWGIYSQTAVNQAKAAQIEVMRLSAAFQQVPEQKTSVINVITNYQQIGMPSISGGTAYGGANTRAGRRAAGGDVLAGFPYLVGERGPEVVVPGQSGNVVSNSDLSNLFDYDQMGRAMEKAFKRVMLRM